MDENKNTFHYTYSASQQEEIKRIREKYAPPTKQEDKMEQLRRLDRSTTKPAMIAALTLGILSCLVLGVGMCCTMVWADRLFVPGIVIGVVGLVGVIVSYPLYTHTLKKRREKLAPEIMRLTDELMK